MSRVTGESRYHELKEVTGAWHSNSAIPNQD